MAFTMTASAALVRPFTPNCTTARRPSGAVPTLYTQVWRARAGMTYHKLLSQEVGGSDFVPAHHKTIWVDEDIVVIMHGRLWQAANQLLSSGVNECISDSQSFKVSARELYAPTSSNAIGCRSVACRSPIPYDGKSATSPRIPGIFSVIRGNYT